MIHHVVSVRPGGTSSLAFDSWREVESRDPSNYRFAFVVDEELPRSFQDAHRALPYLKDVIGIGLEMVNSDDDIVMLTNDDTLLHPSVPWLVKTMLESRDYTCAARVNLPDPEAWQSVVNGARIGRPDCGRDLFAYRARFLRSILDEIPDFVLGAYLWDWCLAADMQFRSGGVSDIVMSHGGSVGGGVYPEVIVGAEFEMPLGFVCHVRHTPHWNASAEHLSRLPSQVYNRNLAVEWGWTRGFTMVPA